MLIDHSVRVSNGRFYQASYSTLTPATSGSTVLSPISDRQAWASAVSPISPLVCPTTQRLLFLRTISTLTQVGAMAVVGCLFAFVRRFGLVRI